MPTIAHPHHRTTHRTTRRLTHALAVLALAGGLALVGPPQAGARADAHSHAPGTGATSPSGCVAAAAQERVRRGAAEGVDPDSVTASEARAMDLSLQQRLDTLGLGAFTFFGPKPARVRVPTYVHVITASDGTGGVSGRQVRAQMRVLNASYAGSTSPETAATPFRFVLRGIDRTANDDWYDWDPPTAIGPSSDEAEAKPALHRGGWRTLNIYLTTLSGGVLGYSYNPTSTTRDLELDLDGVVLLNASLPGGAAAPYDQGDTAVHEVGHWLGLLHTFENGCRAPGDYVADTPYQADGQNIFYCNESDDTCSKPGTDPVHNFMSYGDDACLDRFTRGQAHRMERTWAAFRAHR